MLLKLQCTEKHLKLTCLRRNCKFGAGEVGAKQLQISSVSYRSRIASNALHDRGLIIRQLTKHRLISFLALTGWIISTNIYMPALTCFISLEYTTRKDSVNFRYSKVWKWHKRTLFTFKLENVGNKRSVSRYDTQDEKTSYRAVLHSEWIFVTQINRWQETHLFEQIAPPQVTSRQHEHYQQILHYFKSDLIRMMS